MLPSFQVPEHLPTIIQPALPVLLADISFPFSDEFPPLHADATTWLGFHDDFFQR